MSAKVGYMYWSNGYGMHAGFTKEEAIATTQQASRFCKELCRLTEHDISNHAIGVNTDETYIRDIEFPDLDEKQRQFWM